MGLLRIKSLTKIENTSRLYDIETETHNFFANGILVHNSNLWLGIDDEGKFFTSREGKRKGAARFYSEDEYPRFAAYNGFRGAHAALQEKEIDVKRIMQPGQIVEMEVVYGRQPNVVTYGLDDKSYIAFLRGVEGTPNVVADQLSMTLGGTSVKVTVDIIDTTDGENLEVQPRDVTWQFTGAQVIPADKLKNVNLDKHLKKLEAYLERPAEVEGLNLTNYDLIMNSIGSIPADIRPEAKLKRTEVLAKVMTDFKLPIKKELLDNYVSKVKPTLQHPDVTADEDVGIEGVVLRDPTTGDLIKLVDKDNFTTINAFNHAIRNQVSGVTKTLDGTAPLEARGGILGDMKIKVADLLGNKELARGGTAKRAFNTVKGTTPVETVKNFAKNLSIEDFLGTKRKLLAIIEQAALDLKALLEDFKASKDDFQLKLKNGRTIGITPEVEKRTLLVFAESRRNVLELYEKVKKAKTIAQVIAVLYGHLAKAVHKPEGEEEVIKVRESLTEMNLYKLHSDPKSLDLHDEAQEWVPELFWEKYGSDPAELKKREASIAKDSRYAYYYARNIIDRPFPAGEAAIAKNAELSLSYARGILKKPFPKGEAAIAKEAKQAYHYALVVLKGPFHKGEAAIAEHPIWAGMYARDVLKLPHEEAKKWREKHLKESLLKEMNLYKLHSDPKSLDLHDEQENIPALLRSINKLAFAGTTQCDINSGDCYNWAAVAKRLIPEAELYWIKGHAFIKIGDKYYDAERVTGVKDWRNLPQNKDVPKYRELDEPSRHRASTTPTEAEFYKYWKISKAHINKLVKTVGAKERVTEELVLEKKYDTDKARYSGKDAFTLLNIYFATVLMSALMYLANDARGIRLLKDKTHYKLTSWDKDMSPLNFWGYPIWRASAPAVKKLIGLKNSQAIFKVARRVATAQWRYLHMDLSFGKDVPIEWEDHRKTMRILQQFDGLNVDRINILMDGVFKYETLNHDQQVKVITKLFYYAQQFIPTSPLFVRLKAIQDELLLNATGENAAMVQELKLLATVTALVEDEEQQAATQAQGSQVDIATRAADANVSKDGGTFVKKTRHTVKRKRNPAIKVVKFPRPKNDKEENEPTTGR